MWKIKLDCEKQNWTLKKNWNVKKKLDCEKKQNLFVKKKLDSEKTKLDSEKLNWTVSLLGSWLLNKFSLLAPWEMYREQYGEYAYWYQSLKC